MGLEPTNGGTTIHCLNHLATLAIQPCSIAQFWRLPSACFAKISLGCDLNLGIGVDGFVRCVHKISTSEIGKPHFPGIPGNTVYYEFDAD